MKRLENKTAVITGDAEKHLKKMNIFFNNAGIEGVVNPITEYPVEEYDKLMGV